jgi:hypothetical protein
MSSEPRTIVPFALQASVGCCAPGELLLALAAELHPVDGAAADHALDMLAAPLGVWRHARPHAQLLACADVLADHLRIDPDDPVGLALDTALAAGVAHPLLWCVAGAEAARRAGIGLGVVAGDGGIYGLAHVDDADPLVLDPFESAVVDPHALAPGGLRWRCGHQLAHLLLGLIARRATAEGRRGDADRALELALGLPLSPARGAPW